MKKTFNININGASFIIDEDAFQLLNQYLDTIKHAYCANNDTAELLTDIEARIAELFMMKMPSSKTIITLNMAEEVISQIGNPNEFDDIDIHEPGDTANGGTDTNGGTETAMPPRFDNPGPIRKQLYRDSRNKMVGGICSGLAEYVGIDVTWVRIAVVASAFLSASAVFVIYIILWAIVPEATTPLEFMKMRGEQPTMGNIGKTVTGVFNGGQRAAGTQPPHTPFTPQKSDGKRFAEKFAAFCGAISRGVLIIVGVLAVPILVLMAFVAVIVIISLLGYGISSLNFIIPDSLLYMEGGLIIGLTILSSLLVFGLPLSGLVYAIFSNNKKSKHPALRNSLLIIWVIALITFSTGYYICKRDNLYREFIKATSHISSVNENGIVIEGEEDGKNVSITVEKSSDNDSLSMKVVKLPADSIKADNK